jgi:Gas vesicle synthesis protein GvpL/GvpF/DnaJ domain
MTKTLYIYGIAGTAGLPLSQVFGIEGGVTLLEQGDLFAIVGEPPKGNIQELSREKAVRMLLGHQEVVEAAMQKAVVLPVKFGTIAPSETAVRSLLRQQRNTLLELLAEFDGCSQMEIVVLWPMEAVFAEIATDPAIAEARKEAQQGGNEAAAVRLGQAVKAALEKKRAGMQARLGDALKPAVIDVAFNAPMDDRMAANLAVLIGPNGGRQLDAALERLDAEFSGRLTFRCVGPLPPSSFATLQVTFPSAQAIARARLALELTGPLTQKEITSAFRRLALECHPDSPTAGEQASERMDELTRAYRLLLACAKARQASQLGDELGEPVLLEVAGRRRDAPQELQKGAA